MSTEQGQTLLVRVVEWELHRDELRAVRDPVFVVEQGVPPEIEWDEHEEHASHFLVTEGDRPVACGRMTADGKVGRMAVLASHRGRGLGKRILEEIIHNALGAGMPRLYLHAQQHASQFYEKNGFASFGDPFEEAGIAHIAMELMLDYSDCTNFIGALPYPSPFDQLAVQLCKSAARQLCILSPRLDHAVFDREELVRAISQLARQSRQTQVRILIQDSRPLVARGHRLLGLARRIPSSVKIQRLSEHPDWNNETLVIRDRDGVLYKPGGSDHDGFFEPASRASTQRHLELFEELWRYSVQDVELRSLSI